MQLTFSPLVVSADTASFSSPARPPLHLSASPSTSTVLPFKPTKRTHLVGISRRLLSESSQQRVTFVPTFHTTPTHTTPFLTQKVELTTITPTLFPESNALDSSFPSTSRRPVTSNFTASRPAPAFTFRPQTRRPFFFRPFSGTRVTQLPLFCRICQFCLLESSLSPCTFSMQLLDPYRVQNWTLFLEFLSETKSKRVTRKFLESMGKSTHTCLRYLNLCATI